MTLQYKLILAGLILLILGGISTMIYSKGYHARDTEIVQLNDKLLEIDRRTKETVAKQEVTTHEITTQYEDDKSVLIAYYANRLQHTPKNTCTCATPNSAQGSNGSTNEPGYSGQSTEGSDGTRFEESCALDALQVMKFQDWVKQNGFPIGE